MLRHVFTAHAALGVRPAYLTGRPTPFERHRRLLLSASERRRLVYHLEERVPMVRRGEAEPMLTPEERDALAHLPSHPIEDYAVTLAAVRPVGGQWTWEFRSLKAKRMYDSPDSARDAFEAYLVDLMALERAERERGCGAG